VKEIADFRLQIDERNRFDWPQSFNLQSEICNLKSDFRILTSSF